MINLIKRKDNMFNELLFDSLVSFTHNLWIEAETEYHKILNLISNIEDFKLRNILLSKLRLLNIKKGQTKQNYIDQIKNISTTKETTTTTNYFNKLLKNIFSKNSNNPDNN
jgi:Mg2+/Co2+ transporter CorC